MADDDIISLGGFKIPKDVKKCYSGSVEGGSLINLQSDFKDKLSEIHGYLQREKGIQLFYGIYGLMKPATIDRLASTGQSFYKSKENLFASGLGIVIDPSSKWGDEGKNAQTSLFYKYGLMLNTEPTSKVVWIRPRFVTITDEVDSVEYDKSKESTSSSDSSGSSSGGGGGPSSGQIAYFFSNQFQVIQYDAMSNMLTGEKAILNDVTLWSTVIKAVQASLRSCASGPNGSFIAWYPDYWGMYGNKVETLILEDIELLNLTITQSDAEFYSHVFVRGTNLSGSVIDASMTAAVVSIEDNLAALSAEYFESEPADTVSALMENLLYIPEKDRWRYTPRELYRRYGARPTETTSMGSLSNLVVGGSGKDGQSNAGSTTGDSVESNPADILPILYALYLFMEKWANQYQAKLDITFMPELFPGCRIKLRSKDISFYVKSVSHNMNYTSGFTTTVECICPIGSLVSGMAQPKTPASSDSALPAEPPQSAPTFTRSDTARGGA